MQRPFWFLEMYVNVISNVHLVDMHLTLSNIVLHTRQNNTLFMRIAFIGQEKGNIPTGKPSGL